MGHTNKRDKDGNTITKPTCIISYNHNMGGVDMIHQQLDAIDVLRKSYKWYKKLFMRLVIQCTLSAHKSYKLQGGKDDFLHFLLDACIHLFINAPRLERPMKRTAVDSIARLTGRNHWPAKRELLLNGKSEEIGPSHDLSSILNASYKLLKYFEPINTCRSSFRTKPSIEEKTGSMRGWSTMW